MKSAVFGAAFNPPHKGHIDAIEQLTAHFERILLIPNARHAFGKSLCAFAHRLRMTQLIVDDCLPHAPIEVSDIERRLLIKTTENAIYSYHLLQAIQHAQPELTLTLILGPDNATPETWRRFYRHEDIERDFCVFHVEERLPHRSTKLRALIAATPPNRLLDALTPITGLRTAQYILTHQLYQRADEEETQ